MVQREVLLAKPLEGRQVDVQAACGAGCAKAEHALVLPHPIGVAGHFSTRRILLSQLNASCGGFAHFAARCKE